MDWPACCGRIEKGAGYAPLAAWWGLLLYSSAVLLQIVRRRCVGADDLITFACTERFVGTKKTGKGRRKIGRKKRRNRARIRHRK